MVLLRMTPIAYSGEHLPLFATDDNPEGSHAARRIAFCSWTCSRVRGQQWASLHRGRTAPTRESLCWHCVWILWTMLSQTRRGWWPNQSLCYWNSPGHYSSRPFDISDVRVFYFFFFFFSFLPPYLSSRFSIFWKVARQQEPTDRVSGPRRSRPRTDWKHPEYLWFESDFVGTS